MYHSLFITTALAGYPYTVRPTDKIGLHTQHKKIQCRQTENPTFLERSRNSGGNPGIGKTSRELQSLTVLSLATCGSTCGFAPATHLQRQNLVRSTVSVFVTSHWQNSAV